jgi:hypothetical protein
LEFNTTSHNGQAQLEEVQCTRTITPFWKITEFLPFDTFPCPKHNLNSTSWNSKQLHSKSSTIRGSAVHKNYNSVQSYDRVIALCYFSLLFLVQSITWKQLVGIQYNFIQKSITFRESAMHNTYNFILTNYRVIALWYFFLSSA